MPLDYDQPALHSPIFDPIRYMAARIDDDVDLKDHGDVERALMCAGIPIPGESELCLVIQRVRINRRRSKVSEIAALALLAAGFYAAYSVVCSPDAMAQTVKHAKSAQNWLGELAVVGVFIAGLLTFAWCAFGVGASFEERQPTEDDLEALNHRPDEVVQ